MPLSNCNHCGKEFKYNAGRSSGQFCTLECYYESKRSFEIECDTCGKSFHPHHRTQKYCSKKCAGPGISKTKSGVRLVERIKKNCPSCDNTFEVIPSLSDQTYCSRKCAAEGSRKTRTKKFCKECGKEMSLLPSESDRIYCSRKCYNATRMGEHRECKTCGREMYVIPHRIDKGHGVYCSKKCRGIDLRRRNPRRYTKACNICGKKFVTTSRKRKYCNRDCMRQALRDRVTIECKSCGQPMEVTSSDLKAGRKYCSYECTHAGHHPVQLSCEYCDTAFEAYPSEIKSGRKYCSRECSDSARSELWREKPWLATNWKGGITKDTKQDRVSVEYKDWRKKVFARDNYTCRRCGEKADNIHAHHLYPWAEYPHLWYSVYNGHTLCASCHYEITGNEDDYLRSIGLDPTKPPLL